MSVVSLLKNYVHANDTLGRSIVYSGPDVFTEGAGGDMLSFDPRIYHGFITVLLYKLN